MSRAYRCDLCPVDSDDLPDWSIERRGDATVMWSCHAHLSYVLRQLQREWERTELVVTRFTKPMMVYVGRSDGFLWLTCGYCEAELHRISVDDKWSELAEGVHEHVCGSNGS